MIALNLVILNDNDNEVILSDKDKLGEQDTKRILIWIFYIFYMEHLLWYLNNLLCACKPDISAYLYRLRTTMTDNSEASLTRSQSEMEQAGGQIYIDVISIAPILETVPNETKIMPWNVTYGSLFFGLGLLDLANAYCEPVLKRECENIIKRGISVENVAMLYAAAIKFEGKASHLFVSIAFLKFICCLAPLCHCASTFDL